MRLRYREAHHCKQRHDAVCACGHANVLPLRRMGTNCTHTPTPRTGAPSCLMALST